MGIHRNWVAGVSFFFLIAVTAVGQTPSLTVTPLQVNLRMVETGPLSGSQTISVASSTDWEVAMGDGPRDMLLVNKNKGTGTGTVISSLVDWWCGSRPPGTYVQTLVFALTSSPQTKQVVTINLTVIPKLPEPKFTYLAGPTGCTTVEGYPDDATCAVPDEKPSGKFTPPGTGKTYTDPNFGAQVRILTAPRSNHGYSTPSAISANNRYVIHFQENEGTRIIDFKTGKVVRNGLGFSFEGPIWDARNDDVIYFLQGALVRQYKVSNNQTSTVFDFGASPYKFTRISSGGTGDGSKDNWIAIFAPDQQQICALSIDTGAAYCAAYTGIVQGNVTVDFPMMTKGPDKGNGKRYVLLLANPNMLVFSVNLSAKKLDYIYRGGELLTSQGNRDGICDPGEPCLGSPHADTMEDAAGNQYLVTAEESIVPCEFDIVAYQLNKEDRPGLLVELGGGLRRVMRLYRCGGKDLWADIHLGCAKLSPQCVISIGYNHFAYQYPINSTTPIAHTPHVGEVLVIKNLTEVRRLFMHRSMALSTEPDQSYWTTPRACLSPDGSYVMADSNFGEPNRHRVVVAETGTGRVSLTSPAAVNAASLDAPVSPGSFVTLLGNNLANCYQAATAFPFPESLCDTSVAFGGTKAPLLYASPGQLNVLLPDSVLPGTDTPVVVKRGEAEDEQVTVTLPAASVVTAAPAIFTYQLSDGKPRAVMQNPDGSLNGPTELLAGSRPLRVNEVGVVYANGLGPTSPQPSITTPAPSQEPLARVTAETFVIVNDTPQQVFYAGLTPQSSRLFQINFQLAPSTPIHANSDNFLWISVNGRESPRLNISLLP